MTIVRVSTVQELGDGDGVVVRIAVPSGTGAFARCLDSVIEHTDADEARVLVVDPDGRTELVLQAAHSRGRTIFVSDASLEPATGDLVLLDGECVVSAGWLAGLRVAAGTEPRVATVSPVVGAAGTRTRLDLTEPAARCALFRRPALELVGPLGDDRAGFARRCVTHGLRHELAPQARVDVAERPAARPVSVTLDGRCLSASATGTAAVVLGLVAGLRAHGGVDVRVLVLEDLPPRTRALIEGVGATPCTVAEAEREGPTDIAHRPYQLGVVDDLRVLRAVGRRIVVTHLDSIAYRTAAHFPDDEQWQAYRRLTQLALVAADGVVFLSEDAAADAVALGLIDPGRGVVIAPTTEDSFGAGSEAASTMPLPCKPYLLCLGTDFAHKNRPFAIRLLAALRDADLFDGALVFAGPHVALGSSAEEEAAELAAHAALREHVHELGALDEADKHALLEKAAAVVYPTTYEGFGLVPYEAARAGVPTLFAWTSALRDHLPEELALLVPWDAGASARRAAPVLAAGEPRDQQVRRVTEIGKAFTTAENARRHLELYDAARGGPRRPSARMAERVLQLSADRDRLAEELAGTRSALTAYSEDPLARGLVGPHAVVPEELRRLALAVAARPWLRGVFLAVYRLLHVLKGLDR